MTVDQFFEKLEGLGLEWQGAGGWIRDARDCDCPIIAVAGGGYLGSATTALGLNARSAYAIVRAADNMAITRTQRRYRKRLLRACGLEAA